jgi:hypothetical protein
LFYHFLIDLNFYFYYFFKMKQTDKVRETNGSVLVHCLAGISRSPTVAIAYVMRHLQMTFDDAFRYVKSKRSSISPNFNFLGQLLEYERQLRAEEVLDSSVGDVTNCLQPSSQPMTSSRCTSSSTTTSTSPAPGRERCLSRSISLSLSLKTPALETVPHSCSPSPSSDHLLQNPFGFAELVVDEVDGSTTTKTRPILTADLSPTTALSRLSFEALEAAAAASGQLSPPPEDSEIKETSSSSYLMVSRRKNHTREETYRSLRQRMSNSSVSSSTEMSHSYYSSKQKTETTSSRSSSSMVLTVSQSQRVQSSSSSVSPLATATPAAATTIQVPTATANQGRNHRWKLSPMEPSSPSSHCSEISVQIEESKAAKGSASVQSKEEAAEQVDNSEQVDEEAEQVEIRRRGPSFPRPHSDTGGRSFHRGHHHIHHPLHHTRSVPRRPSYAPSETCYSPISDEMLMPPTPSSPPPPSNSSSSSCSSHHLMGGLLSPQGISSSNSVSGAWGVVSPGLYARSDSVTTSGLGSEISDSEMGQSRADLDALSLCSGMSGTLRGGGGSIAGLGFLESETDFSSLPPDDGVFTEPLFLPPPPPVRLQPPPRGGSARPSRPSSLLGKFN